MKIDPVLFGYAAELATVLFEELRFAENNSTPYQFVRSAATKLLASAGRMAAVAKRARAVPQGDDLLTKKFLLEILEALGKYGAKEDIAGLRGAIDASRNVAVAPYKRGEYDTVADFSLRELFLDLLRDLETRASFSDLVRILPKHREALIK